jgi:hypothetical protein
LAVIERADTETRDIENRLWLCDLDGQWHLIALGDFSLYWLSSAWKDGDLYLANIGDDDRPSFRRANTETRAVSVVAAAQVPAELFLLPKEPWGGTGGDEGPGVDDLGVVDPNGTGVAFGKMPTGLRPIFGDLPVSVSATRQGDGIWVVTAAQHPKPGSENGDVFVYAAKLPGRAGPPLAEMRFSPTAPPKGLGPKWPVGDVGWGYGVAAALAPDANGLLYRCEFHCLNSRERPVESLRLQVLLWQRPGKSPQVVDILARYDKTLLDEPGPAGYDEVWTADGKGGLQHYRYPGPGHDIYHESDLAPFVQPGKNVVYYAKGREIWEAELVAPGGGP